jgi:hypothetical protein
MEIMVNQTMEGMEELQTGSGESRRKNLVAFGLIPAYIQLYG